MENQNEKSIQDYINYVQEHTRKYEGRFSLLKADGDIDPEKLYREIAEYSGVMSMLIAESNRLLHEQKLLEKNYQEWFDEKYVNMRRELNPVTIAAAKWISKSEIEAEVRVRYKTEYRAWKDKLDEMDSRVSFVKGFLTTWSKQSDMLQILSYKVQREWQGVYTTENTTNTMNTIRKRNVQ